MRFSRSFLFAVVLVSAFFYFTTYRSGRLNPPSWISHPQHVEITEAAGSLAFDAEEQNNINVYRKNIASVVNITSRVMVPYFFYGLVPQEGQGSGFVIDKEGHILTNYHVISEAQQVEVTLHNRKKYKASIVGVDKSHDLAIVQIKAPDLQPMTLGDSTNLQVGQKVYAIGNPFGLAGTLTRGIVSSIRQVQEPDGLEIDEAIQTDAAINPGNSGGPLLNYHGEVIGINTLLASSVGQSAGIGFAIPINTAKAVLNDLVTLGRVRRPALGVHTIPIDAEIADELGLAADYPDCTSRSRRLRRSCRTARRHRTRLPGQHPHHDWRRLDRRRRRGENRKPATARADYEPASGGGHSESNYLPRQEADGSSGGVGRSQRPGVSSAANAS
jgi:S1-C subfamily serine protease